MIELDSSQTPNWWKRRRLHTAMDSTNNNFYTNKENIRDNRTTVPLLQRRNDDVFEITNDSVASVRNRLQTMERQESLLNPLEALSQTYIVLSPKRGCSKWRSWEQYKLHYVYGVYLDNDGMMLGEKRFYMENNDNIIIDGVRYVGTPGQLILKKFPDNAIYTKDDMQKYKSMLLMTNAHRRNHRAHGQMLSKKGYKYKHIIAPLLSIEPQKRSGRGRPRLWY